MGLLMVNPKSQIKNPKFFDGSYRAAETTLNLYLAATNDLQHAEYDTEAAIAALPKAHPSTMRYIHKSIWKNYKKGAYSNVVYLCQQAIQRKRALIYDAHWCEIPALLAIGKKSDAFEALLRSLLLSPMPQDYNTRKSCLLYGLQKWKWTNRSEKLRFYKIAYKAALCLILDEEKYFIGMLDSLIEE